MNVQTHKIKRKKKWNDETNGQIRMGNTRTTHTWFATKQTAMSGKIEWHLLYHSVLILRGRRRCWKTNWVKCKCFIVSRSTNWTLVMGIHSHTQQHSDRSIVNSVPKNCLQPIWLQLQLQFNQQWQRSHGNQNEEMENNIRDNFYFYLFIPTFIVFVSNSIIWLKIDHHSSRLQLLLRRRRLLLLLRLLEFFYFCFHCCCDGCSCCCCLIL